jgi:hypothetical protein
MCTREAVSLVQANLVKGYEFQKNTYLLLTNEDFDSVKVGVEGPTARKRTVAYFTRYRSLPEAGINGGQNYRLVLCSYYVLLHVRPPICGVQYDVSKTSLG